MGAKARQAHGAGREAGTPGDVFSARRGALPMKSDIALPTEIILALRNTMGIRHRITKLLRIVSVFPTFDACCVGGRSAVIRNFLILCSPLRGLG